MEDVQEGLRTAIRNVGKLPGKIVAAMGVSGMMHGYLAFDKDWNLLAPFRTWQNTMTARGRGRADRGRSASTFPQRWSIAHLYQAVLNGETARQEHRPHHHAGGLRPLRCSRAKTSVGVGEASGMFPIDSETLAPMTRRCWTSSTR